MDRSDMTEKILSLTLKIIYLLTGEDYVPIKKSDDDDIPAPLPPSHERKNDEQILDLTNQIIELLTGEGEHLKEVKDEPMSNAEEDGNLRVWATLECKEEEVPMTINKEVSSQTNSQDDEQEIPPVDGIQCKEEEIAVDISSGKSKLSPINQSHQGPVDATQDIADLPVGHGEDPSETRNTPLNIVVIDAGERDPRFKEEEEQFPIGPRSGGSKRISPGLLRTCHSKTYIEEEEEESNDTETEEEDDIVSGLKVIVKSEEVETRVKIKEEEAVTDISPGCRKSCCKGETDEEDAAMSAADRKIYPINRRLVTAEKPFYCPDCGGFFKHKSSLVLHRRIHSGEKPFLCKQCGKEFIQKANYVRHQRLHTGEKPYKCTECGKLYAQKQSLIMHQKFHAENEPFSCPECGENFIRQSHLVTHRKSHKGLKRYSCQDCGDFFMLRSSLVIHQRVHTAEKAFCS
ncbi:uncharacterized protein LOC142663444 [Rhinoderma darwinii]|uniref:uncharacterized protein LOC142663444 n=1 Tax=Rhinoderma darwinii TaxID=43563 RepID=UPI003F671A60